MQRSDSIRRQSAGFTLIELLVVMAIIILIVGLAFPTFWKIRMMGQQMSVSAEINEMGTAVETFKSTYHAPYVPTALILCSDYNAAIAANPTWAAALNDSRSYLTKVWPSANMMSALPPNTLIQLDGNQVLVFLLGGPGPTDSRFTAGWAGNRSGFMNSPTNPFNRQGNVCFSPADGSVAKANGAFFNFKPDRIDSFSHYHDPYWDKSNLNTSIYYYFSSRNGNDYKYFGIYYPALNPSAQVGGFTLTGGYGGMEPFVGADGKYIRPDTFQIISPGRDARPGTGGVFEPGVGAYSPGGPGGDDLSSFHKGTLGGD